MWMKGCQSRGPASISNTRIVRVFGEAIGEYAAGRAGADDDVVEDVPPRIEDPARLCVARLEQMLHALAAKTRFG
jgi:hypothetical protein